MDDNNKRENHRYLADTVSEALGRAMKPKAWMLGLWLVLVVGFVVAFQMGLLEGLARTANSPVFVPGLILLIMVMVIGGALAVARMRQSSFRSDYVKALASPTPEPLIEVIERSRKTNQAVPEVDALTAHSKAIAYALYGDEANATRALGGVNWGPKAPLIQAIGLSSEGIIELLCRRDVQRSLEATRRARALASVNGAIPGAAQSERYHGTCVAVGEALGGIESATSLRWLEESAADARFPAQQLLACFGLAVALERSGDKGRAAQLRAFIERLAPHCGPLRLAPEPSAPK